MGKLDLWRSQQYFLRSVFSIRLYSQIIFNSADWGKVFSVDAHMFKKVQALIGRRTERAASDQSLFFLSLHKPSFLR